MLDTFRDLGYRTQLYNIDVQDYHERSNGSVKLRLRFVWDSLPSEFGVKVDKSYLNLRNGHAVVGFKNLDKPYDIYMYDFQYNERGEYFRASNIGEIKYLFSIEEPSNSYRSRRR